MGRAIRCRQPSKSERREKVKQTARDKKVKSGYGEIIPFERSSAKVITPRTDKQRILIASIVSNILTFATGCAGGGKSHIALACAVRMLLNKEIDQIVLTKPQFEIGGENLGLLPGGVEEKTAVLFRPMRDILNKLLGASHVDNLVRQRKILLEPLGSILGTTFDKSAIIIDEAQNTTPGQMKAVLTRVGEDTRIIVCGDYKEQVYIEGRCGLEDALLRFKNIDSVGVVDFTTDDIVRSGFCKDVVLAYRKMI